MIDIINNMIADYQRELSETYKKLNDAYQGFGNNVTSENIEIAKEIAVTIRVLRASIDTLNALLAKVETMKKQCQTM